MSKYDDRLADYVEVKDRIRLFYEKHPTGRLVTAKVKVTREPDDVPRVWVKALAYRDPEDEYPAPGWSWMVLPGSTPYTRGSELENTETSAIGRAIGMLGIGIEKSIASAQEVRNKEGEGDRPEPEHIGSDGLIGTVEWGKPPVDGNLRQTPDGPAWGFRLRNGRKAYQVLARGELAEVLGGTELGKGIVGQRVSVWGHIEMVPWDKAGKSMPPFPRVHLARIQTPEWILPSADGAAEEEAAAPSHPEAESIPMLPLDDEERALVGGGLPE
jgi:hypothetical protein